MFLPKGKTAEFIEHFRECVKRCIPTFCIIQTTLQLLMTSTNRFEQGYLENAWAWCTGGWNQPSQETFSDTRKIAPTLLTGVTLTCELCKTKSLGHCCRSWNMIKDDVIEFINSRPRPLALYYFDFDQARADYVAQRTHSGHFGQNTVLTHVAQDDLPFGGVGASGMGNIMVQKVSSVCRMNGQWCRIPSYIAWNSFSHRLTNQFTSWFQRPFFAKWSRHDLSHGFMPGF